MRHHSCRRHTNATGRREKIPAGDPVIIAMMVIIALMVAASAL
jgi:hypothetical protein